MTWELNHRLKMSLLKRLGLTALLTLVSYILFVPMCTFCGVAAAEVGFREGYGPDLTGLSVASLISAVFVLNLVFGITLARLR